MRPRLRGGLLSFAAAALAILALSPAASAARQMGLGLFDYPYPTSQAHSLWLDRSWDAGARLVQVDVNWAEIAPLQRTPGFDPADPADPGYRFATLDSIVRDEAAKGFQTAFFVIGAPTWAERPNRPGTADAAEGSWRPDAGEYGQFMQALAKRYSGTYAPPLAGGASLPRVRYYRVWNEPNLNTYLNPQWAGTRPVAPNVYRGLLNAAYDGIKAVDRSDVVIAGGLAPYGDQPGEDRMRPITFLRRLFCLKSKRDQRAPGCRRPARFDVIAHNPINQYAPWRPAGNPLDVTTPDLGRIRSLLRAGRRLGTIQPRRPKPLWVSEFWWATRPPSPTGVPAIKQAHWLEYALYLFWKQGVKEAIWLGISDPEPGSDIVALGLYTSDGRPKPALKAFRLPFVAEVASASSHAALAWGRAPEAGTVLIQRLAGRTWRTVKRIHRSRAGVFTAHLRVAAGTKLRAKLTPSGATSVPWTTNVAHRSGNR